LGARTSNAIRLYQLQLPENKSDFVRNSPDSYDLSELEIIRFKNRLFHFSFNPVFEYESGMLTENGSLFLWRPDEE